MYICIYLWYIIQCIWGLGAALPLCPPYPLLQALQQTLQECVTAKSQLQQLNALVLTKARLESYGNDI